MKKTIDPITLGYIILAILVIVSTIWWVTAQWRECRDAGFSKLYCIQHVS
jgi:hypothetical protein